jgi:hypothetical protein
VYVPRHGRRTKSHTHFYKSYDLSNTPEHVMLLSHQLSMSFQKERVAAMEALLLEHKIKLPKPCKNTEPATLTDARVNKRNLIATRTLERLQTDGTGIKLMLARRGSRAVPAEFDLDLLECIAPFLGFKSLGMLRQVNRQWRSTFHQGSIVRAVLSTTDYVTESDVYAMTTHLGCYEFSRALRECSVGGIATVRVEDMLCLLDKHGYTWEKIARAHSAMTAMRLAFLEVPVPSHVLGERRRLEIQRCTVCIESIK